MLRLDLAEIIRTVGLAQTYDIDEPPYTDEDIEYVAPVRGRVTISNSGRLLHARGYVDTVVSQECSRCLADVRTPVRASIEEQYSVGEVENAQYRDVQPKIVQDDENEVPPGLFDGTVMNLGVLIRQAAILAAPLQPLCREECAGLCPRCGKNLNEGSCKCTFVSTVKPFADLPELFKEEPNRN